MAPKQSAAGPQYLDENHQRLVEFADWAYEDDPDERELFLDYHMGKRGYQRTSGWSLPPAPPANGQGDPAPDPQPDRRPAYFKR